jgi:spore coat polysaccharide biosynthesis protein SpsF
MTTLALLQARMSSRRLPGKVLEELHGLPMILRQIERLKRSAEIDELIVATSIDPTDDILVEVIQQSGITVHRGELNNVFLRFLEALEVFPADEVVRLTADCPLTDHRIIDRVIRSHRQSGCDYTSNSLIRTFPRGLDCEVFQPAVLARLSRFKLTSEEVEHVTLGVYSRPGKFSLNSFQGGLDNSRRRWTVDTPEDLKFVRYVYSELYDNNPDFSSNDIFDLLDRDPEKERLESV